METKPSRGGFAREIRCGIFIRDYLKGLRPFGSPRIDPGEGAATQDIFSAYKLALHASYAGNAVDRENEDRVKQGLSIYTEEEYQGRLDWHRRRLPYKLVKSRYHSFQRYFHWLKQLGWVELTGKEMRSEMQDYAADHPDTHPRKFYKLTREGIQATEEDWQHPQLLLYPQIAEKEPDEEKSKYRRARKGDRFLRPFTAGQFIFQYLSGLGPENSSEIDPDEGDYCEHIFFYYKQALRRAYARNAVELENDRRVQKGLEPYSPEEYADRLEWHMERTPYKMHRARYHSFFRYFHYLKQLGFIEPTGVETESYIQSLDYIAAPPCRYYRLSIKGKGAPEPEWYRPQLTLYPEFTPQYFAAKNLERKQAGR